jgi:hypothetical protein
MPESLARRQTDGLVAAGAAAGAPVMVDCTCYNPL